MHKRKYLMIFLENIPIFLCLAIFLIFSILTPKFLSIGNLLDILTAVAYVGILAVGMTFVIITGGIDLSVGSVVYLSSLIPALLIRDSALSVPIALIICLLVGAAIGAINAFFIVKMKMIPFLVTLCTMVGSRGLAIFLCNSQVVKFPREITNLSIGKIMGIPLPIIFLAVVVAIAFFIQEKTPIGRQIYAIGNNIEVARKAGINTERVAAFAYIICGIFAALGGIMSVFQMGGVINASAGEGAEFQAIAAVVLGGASLSGGIGSVFPGTLLGAIIIKLLNVGLIYLGTDMYFQNIISALIILLAVFIDSLKTSYIYKLGRKNIRIEEQK